MCIIYISLIILDGISEKSAVKANTIPSNTSDSINNEYQMDNSHVEYSSRDINTNQSNSLNMNTSMNSSINITSPRLSRNNSNQYNPEELININTNNNNRKFFFFFFFFYLFFIFYFSMVIFIIIYILQFYIIICICSIIKLLYINISMYIFFIN